MRKLTTHPLYIVDPSLCPYQVSIASFQMLFGLILYMHFFVLI